MRHQGFPRSTPWQLVQGRFFDGQAPDILTFSKRHGLDPIEVAKLFSGEIISFSLPICAALDAETKRMGREMSKGFFRRISNRWPPHPPPATSAALSPEGRSLL